MSKYSSAPFVALLIVLGIAARPVLAVNEGEVGGGSQPRTDAGFA